MPTKSELAKLNALHYKLADGDRKDVKKATKKVSKLGYEINSLNRGVASFKSTKPDDKHLITTIKGTDVKNFSDIKSDLALAVGLSGKDKQFRDRQKEIKKIYASNPDTDKYLTAHSLGSSIALKTMVNSKSIRDNTKQAVLFNTGMTPAFNAELSKGLTKENKKDLKQKVVQHHVKGDVISASLTMGTQIGKVKTQKAKDGSAHSLSQFHADKSLDVPAVMPEPEPEIGQE
jgi:hypothetical protein